MIVGFSSLVGDGFGDLRQTNLENFCWDWLEGKFMRIKMNCEVAVFLEQTQGINIIFETHVNECTLI